MHALFLIVVDLLLAQAALNVNGPIHLLVHAMNGVRAVAREPMMPYHMRNIVEVYKQK